MRLILSQEADFLFLVSGEEDSDNFRILAEMEFSDLSFYDRDGLQFFTEEANEKLDES